MICKICDSKAYKLMEVERKRPDFPAIVNVYECESCNLIFTDGLDNFTTEDYKNFYKYPDYLQFDPIARREFYENFLNRSKLLIAQVDKYIKETGNKAPKILVYGNGVAKALPMLIEKGYDAFGYMSSIGLDKEIVPNDLWRFYEQFDVIVSTEVAEHFAYPLAEFSLIKNLLKKGGWTIHSTGCKERWLRNCNLNITYGLGYLISPEKQNGGHCTFYSYESVDRIAKILGMKNRVYEIGDNKIGLALVKE